MPLYAVTCVDKPGMADVRASIRQTHLDYLAAHADIVVLGGVTFGADDAKDGSVWIIRSSMIVLLGAASCDFDKIM